MPVCFQWKGNVGVVASMQAMAAVAGAATGHLAMHGGSRWCCCCRQVDGEVAAQLGTAEHPVVAECNGASKRQVHRWVAEACVCRLSQ